MWKNEVILTIHCFFKYHIDAMVTDEGRVRKEWQLIGIYGQPETGRRNETWELLRLTKSEGNHAWLVFGYFNEILNINEKQGGREGLERHMPDFR